MYRYRELLLAIEDVYTGLEKLDGYDQAISKALINITTLRDKMWETDISDESALVLVEDTLNNIDGLIRHEILHPEILDIYDDLETIRDILKSPRRQKIMWKLKKMTEHEMFKAIHCLYPGVRSSCTGCIHQRGEGLRVREENCRHPNHPRNTK